MNDPFNVILNSVCWNYIKNFCIYIHLGILACSFLLVSFSGFGISIVLTL